MEARFDRGVEEGRFDRGVVKLPGGHALQPGAPKPLPTVVVSQEHYNRVMRLLDRGVNVEMEVEIDVVYTDDDPYDYIFQHGCIRPCGSGRPHAGLNDFRGLALQCGNA